MEEIKKENFNNKEQRLLLNKLIINGLYNLFVPPQNPNSPRKPLCEREYTLNYLASRIGVDPLELLLFFRKEPWRDLLLIKKVSPHKIIISFGNELSEKDTFEDFKKCIIDFKKQINGDERKKDNLSTKDNLLADDEQKDEQKKDNLPTHSTVREEKQLKEKAKEDSSQIPAYYSFKELDQIKELTFFEKEYLRLLLEKNPSGIFAVRRSGIRASKLDANLAHIHYNLLKYTKKWESLGILRQEGYKFRILIKKDS